MRISLTDIAFEFASWISPEFKLYIIKDYQRLKKDEANRLAIGWDVKRELSKINYRIHTDAVKEFYREETRTVVKIHPGALEKIREEAYATQEKLIVPEDMTGDGMPVNICREIPGTEEHREETGKAGAGQGLAQEETSSSVFFQESQPQAGDIWQELWAALTETERKGLQLIQQGGTDLKTFSDERDIMLEVLIDGINEKAVDFVGDSLLDQEAAVYDDYIVQVKGMVEEI